VTPPTQEAFAKSRDRELGAEVIDLVHLPSGTRPTPIAYLDYDDVDRCREMDCVYYNQCLSFTARVRWQSFHCRQCPQYKLMRGELVHEGSNEQGPAQIIKLR
jgi:hypothetical protein